MKVTNGKSTSLALREDVTLGPGESYVFPLNMLHRVIDSAGSEAVVSIMLTAPAVLAECRLMSTKVEPSTEEAAYVLPRITPAEVRRRLRGVIAHLEGRLQVLAKANLPPLEIDALENGSGRPGP